MEARPLRHAYFNPPAPCGAGQLISLMSLWAIKFQSTRPLRGGTITGDINIHGTIFQSTRPLRGGTLRHLIQRVVNLISIHPPLAGRDFGTSISVRYREDFNPPAPCGAGQRSCTKSAFTLAVLSGFLALMRPFFLPNVHKFRCEPSEESLLAPRSHAYTIRTPSC